MAEQNEGHAGFPASVELTSKSTTIRTRDGGQASLTRGDSLNALTVSRHGQSLTAWLTLDDLRALLLDPAKCCENCQHARLNNLSTLRCHRRPASRGGFMNFPRVERTGYCGKFEPMVAS